jgi:hypothetical protein
MAINNILLNCSGNTISDAFERIVKRQIPNKKIIGSRNYFLENTAKKVDDLNKLVPFTIKHQKHIEEYIASSILVHNSDGWNYLSRSIDSLLNGDISSSIHLAYYAELRSVMALMAYEGIGIFNRQHIWFDSSKNHTLFRGFTTHSLADDAMRTWANQTSKKNILFDIIKIKNVTLTDWIRETGVLTKSTYVNTIANKWLKNWSIDLHLKEDQNLRNDMSYRPHFKESSIDLKKTLEKLSEIWELLEPTSSNSFPLLDKHLLRIALFNVFKIKFGRVPQGDQYENFLNIVFGRIGESTSQPLFEFLLRESNPIDPIIIIEARKDRINYKVNRIDPLPIICRAILLLRLSTGAARILIDNSTLNKSDLYFWCDRLCYENGISSENPSNVDPVDLFADIRESIDEFRNNPDHIGNVRETSLSFQDSLFNLKQFQRAGIWGIMT